MPCHWIKLDDGTVAHIRTSGHRRKKCWICGQPADLLCDGVLHRTMGGKPLKTCDRPLCTVHTSKGKDPDTDYCEEHRANGS